MCADSGQGMGTVEAVGAPGTHWDLPGCGGADWQETVLVSEARLGLGWSWEIPQVRGTAVVSWRCWGRDGVGKVVVRG